METQIVIEYEVVEPIADKTFITNDYYTAVDYFNDGCMVFEHHKTITQITAHTQSSTRVTMQWHLNPAFNPNN